jgi:predicted permease
MGLKHVLRRLIRLPMFTSLTIVTLGLGIGANAAIFSVVQGVLLKPLPYRQADELVAVNASAPVFNIPDAGTAAFLHFTYEEQARSFQDIGMWNSETVSVTGLAEPEEIRSLDVTVGVLRALGVQPAAGRLFTPEDDSPDGPETVMLTDGYWRAKFGGDPSAVGRTLVLDGRPREIIGVLPTTFRFLDRDPAIVLPMRLDRSKTFLGQFNCRGLARLRPGVTVEAANAEVGRLIPVSLQRFPAFPGFSAKMFEDARLGPLVEPLKKTVTGDLNTVLWLLMGIVGMVLLIACANVANLLLVRVEGRQHELSIRTALGADRRQIARELLLESTTLGLFGGALALVLAFAALRVLVALAPANLPRVDQIGIDTTVLLFTLVV